MKDPENLFEKMLSTEHLFQCWNHFRQGKRKRKDVQYFERHLEDNLFALREELRDLNYQHGPYHQFLVFDPKQRFISKARVKDRVVHEMVHSVLSGEFDQEFIFHSLSSRVGKGTHLGISLLQRMIRRVSCNGTKACFGLKMDIKRFFDTVDQQILKTLIRKRIDDEKFLKITEIIIDGFRTDQTQRGIPLGNVTSQLFANIYLHELDLFVKHELRESYYLRYCDDFIFLSHNENHLKSLIDPIREFLKNRLRLELHPSKIVLKKLSQGIDFIGYVLFPKHTLVRTRTKQRMFKKLREAEKLYLKEEISRESLDQTVQSYLGILSHANQHTLSQAIENAYGSREVEL
jgi:retron-type reverse transcriptase